MIRCWKWGNCRVPVGLGEIGCWKWDYYRDLCWFAGKRLSEVGLLWVPHWFGGGTGVRNGITGGVHIVLGESGCWKWNFAGCEGTRASRWATFPPHLQAQYPSWLVPLHHGSSEGWGAPLCARFIAATLPLSPSPISQSPSSRAPWIPDLCLSGPHPGPGES